MNLDELTTLEAIDAFLAGTQPVVFSVLSGKADRYRWLEERKAYRKTPAGMPAN